MNVTDLRDELTAHADGLGTAPDLAAGVAGRVRTTKRRRAVAAGSVATLAVVALAVGVVTSLGRPAPSVPAGSPSSAAPMVGADGMPFRAVPDAPGDVVKDGLHYRARVADDRLAAGFVGDRGQGQFTLAWEPTTTHVSVGAECYLPGLTADEASVYMVTVSLGGTTGFFGSSCTGGRPQQRDLPAGGAVPGEPGQGWTELTVGRAASVRVQLVDAVEQQHGFGWRVVGERRLGAPGRRWRVSSGRGCRRHRARSAGRWQRCARGRRGRDRRGRSRRRTAAACGHDDAEQD